MKKLSYLLMAAMAVFFIGCANEQNSPVEEPENEELQTLVFNAEIDPDDAPNSNAMLRIAYEDGVAGLRPVWAVGDKIEFLLTNNRNAKRALVGTVTSANENKATIELRIKTELFDSFANRLPITYHAVTGSGIVGGTQSGGLLFPHLRLVSPKYFQGGGSWNAPAANYQLIKTNHVVNNKVVGQINNNANADYNAYLKPSIIQLATGTMTQTGGNTLKFRNIGSLFAVTINNTSNTDLNIYKLTFRTKSSGKEWVYALNNADNRFDPATFDMKPGSVKAGSYAIFDASNQSNSAFNIPANSEKTIYQWFMPVKGASVSDLQLEVVSDVQGNVIKTIDLSGDKTFAPAKRVKISRTWNGTEFVK